MDRDNSSIHQIADLVELSDMDLGGRSSPDGAVTILFSDIEGSTEMVERLGDEAWFELLREHNRIVRELVKAHDGTEVKAQGDGFMLAFMSSRAALACAIEMQHALDGYALENPDERLRVRVGLHSGFMIQDGQDYFGRNVILAARIADRARGGEIIVSEQLREYTAGDDRAPQFLPPQQLALKGLSGTHTVYPVDWSSPTDP